MSLIKKFLQLVPRLISQDFTAASEGSTNSGIHETAVANFFVNEGFPHMAKTVIIKTVNTRTNKEKETDEYVMDRTSHSPKPFDLPYTDGFYTILQPYSKTGRGAMNPAPDLYLVDIQDKRITQWLGLECKSSKDSLCPMWNEHLPRDYEKGNILYFFTGYDKASKKKMNTLFTSRSFFRGLDGNRIEEKFWLEVRAEMMAKWEKEYAKDFPMVKCKLRQFCGQNPFTVEEMSSMTKTTMAFLSAKG